MQRPNPNFELFEGDRVFIENGPDTNYYILNYEIASAAWVLTPYTNKDFHTKKTNQDGLVIPKFLFLFGYDEIKKVDDFDKESLK